MIKTFTDKRTQELYTKGQSKKFPADVARRAARKLEYVNLAQGLDDLKVPPGNRLHPLSGNRQGQRAILINDQWRICFRFEDGDAYEVDDYSKYGQYATQADPSWGNAARGFHAGL